MCEISGSGKKKAAEGAPSRLRYQSWRSGIVVSNTANVPLQCEAFVTPAYPSNDSSSGQTISNHVPSWRRTLESSKHTLQMASSVNNDRIVVGGEGVAGTTRITESINPPVYSARIFAAEPG